MSDVTTSDVAKYIALKQAEGLKNWTVRGHLTVLSGVFSYSGRHLGFVGVNPVSLLDRVERPGREDESSKRILDADELMRLLGAVEDRYRLIFAFAAETGARLSEVLGLTWQEIGFEDATVSFTHQLGRDGKRAPLQSPAAAVARSN